MVHVRDAGPGSQDLFAGFAAAATSADAGVGLWLTHHLDVDVTLTHADASFTVRLRGGQLPEPTR